MIITLSPIASQEDDTPPTVNGDAITYRGDTYDLSQLPDGGEVEADLPFVGKIKRLNGILHVVLQYQYSTATAQPSQSTNISDYTFDVASGKCECPILRRETL